VVDVPGGEVGQRAAAAYSNSTSAGRPPPKRAQRTAAMLRQGTDPPVAGRTPVCDDCGGVPSSLEDVPTSPMALRRGALHRCGGRCLPRRLLDGRRLEDVRRACTAREGRAPAGDGSCRRRRLPPGATGGAAPHPRSEDKGMAVQLGGKRGVVHQGPGHGGIRAGLLRPVVWRCRLHPAERQRRLRHRRQAHLVPVGAAGRPWVAPSRPQPKRLTSLPRRRLQL
jgi:hypothetical protein